MRALCLTATGGPQHLSLSEIDAPTLTNPRSVRVGVRAVGLNHLDIWVADGLKNVPLPSFPHVVGADAAGVILEVGDDVDHLAVGERVVLNPGLSCGECEACLAGDEVFCPSFGLMGEHRGGTAAEEIVVPARNVLPITGDWSWAEAAGFSLATLTAWRMLITRAQLTKDESVLIWGIGGGVAIQALQIARDLGAQPIVTSSSDQKLEKALALGAELTINHRDHEDVHRLVREHLGRGADLVVDTVGEPTWKRSLKSIRPGGRLVTCGATGGAEVGIDIRRLFWFQWSLLGSTMGTSREFAEVVALGNEGKLRPPVDRVFSLEDGAEGYRRLIAGDQFGKVVLEVSR